MFFLQMFLQMNGLCKSAHAPHNLEATRITETDVNTISLKNGKGIILSNGGLINWLPQLKG